MRCVIEAILQMSLRLDEIEDRLALKAYLRRMFSRIEVRDGQVVSVTVRA